MLTKNLLKKGSLLILSYYVLLFLQACCGCEESITPYYDYKSIIVENGNKVDSVGYFNIRIIPNDIEFLAHSEESNFNLINAAFACSCSKDGEAEKYPISSINIYPDATFKNDIPISQSISSLFEILTSNFYTHNPDYPLIYAPLKNNELYSSFERGSEIRIRTKEVPVSKNKEYRFTIEIVKENGDIVSAVSQPIIWE